MKKLVHIYGIEKHELLKKTLAKFKLYREYNKRV